MLLLSSVFCLAQQGSVSYSRTLYWSSSQAAGIEDVLYFNIEASLYYQPQLVLDMSKAEFPKIENTYGYDVGEPVEVMVGEPSGLPKLYYRELASKKIFCRIDAKIKSKKFKTYLYEDEGARQLDWKLEDKYKTISGYECQKASVTFRGRNYDAWFTTEIPLPYGPWKFGGLPGLILEIYDDTKEISFTAENIIIPDPEAASHIIVPEGIEMTHRDFISQKNAASQKRINAIRSRIIPKGAISLKRTRTRNAIELAYEWDKK